MNLPELLSSGFIRHMPASTRRQSELRAVSVRLQPIMIAVGISCFVGIEENVRGRSHVHLPLITQDNDAGARRLLDTCPLVAESTVECAGLYRAQLLAMESEE